MQQLAAFSGMHAHALAALENGTLSDIGYNGLAALLQLLSLSFESLSISARLAKRGRWMAAKNVSASFIGTKCRLTCYPAYCAAGSVRLNMPQISGAFWMKHPLNL